MGSNESWENDLKKIIAEHKIRIAFDCIAGPMTGTLLNLLPPGKSTVFVYGRLSQQPVGNIPPLDLIYRGKTVEGWLVSRWLDDGKGMLRKLLKLRKVWKLVSNNLASIFGSNFRDTKMETALADYNVLLDSGTTGTKMRIRFDA